MCSVTDGLPPTDDLVKTSMIPEYRVLYFDNAARLAAIFGLLYLYSCNDLQIKSYPLRTRAQEPTSGIRGDLLRSGSWLNAPAPPSAIGSKVTNRLPPDLRHQDSGIGFVMSGRARKFIQTQPETRIAIPPHAHDWPHIFRDYGP